MHRNECITNTQTETMAKIIKDQNGNVVSNLACIAKYFRKQSESLADFNGQCKALSPEDREELAIGAAKELGYTVE